MVVIDIFILASAIGYWWKNSVAEVLRVSHEFKDVSVNLNTVITTTSTHRWGSCVRHPPGGASSVTADRPRKK